MENSRLTSEILRTVIQTEVTGFTVLKISSFQLKICEHSSGIYLRKVLGKLFVPQLYLPYFKVCFYVLLKV